MSMLEQLNAPLEYIEENLSKNIDFKEVSVLASCSQSYFKRIFSSLTGITITEYIRRRRVTLAAFDINKNSVRVIDIANKYGYSSPDSFTKAFKAFHGITPSQAKIEGNWLKVYSQIVFQLSVYREESYETKTKEDIH